MFESDEVGRRSLGMREARKADSSVNAKVLIDYEEPLFTFDDGPSEWTAAILDLLEQHNRRAIFFCTGMHVDAHSEIVRRAFKEGHRIGNHAWSHRRLSTLTPFEIRSELTDTNAAIYRAIGIRPRVWRAPYFDAGATGEAIGKDLGMRFVGANLIPDDWMATDPEALAAVVLSEIKPGSVVSLHDGIPPDGGSAACTDSREVTTEALRLILEGMA